MARAEVVVGGLGVPEGPVVHLDGRVTFTEQTRGRISCWDGDSLSVVATTGGAPNSHVAGDDGCLYVAQNGGVVGGWRSPDRRQPGVQRVRPDGSVEMLRSSVGGTALVAPNDLVFGPDGGLYLTDPGHAFDPVHRGTAGRLLRLDASGGEVLVDVGPKYPNGVAFLPDGSLVWVESYDRQVCRLGADGERLEICQLPEGHIPDGLAVAMDGRMFISTCGSHGITVVSPHGEVLDLLLLDDAAVPTNCAWDDRGGLWVTDFGTRWEQEDGAGRLWRVQTDGTGLPPVLGHL